MVPKGTTRLSRASVLDGQHGDVRGGTAVGWGQGAPTALGDGSGRAARGVTGSGNLPLDLERGFPRAGSSDRAAPIFWLGGFLSQLPRQDSEVLCFLAPFKGTFDWRKGSKKDGRVKLQRFEKFPFWKEGFCYD